MRKVGITLMVSHPFVDYYAAHAHSGHSTGGQLDDYIKMVGIGLSQRRLLMGKKSLEAPSSCIIF